MTRNTQRLLALAAALSALFMSACGGASPSDAMQPLAVPRISSTSATAPAPEPEVVRPCCDSDPARQGASK